MSQPQDPRTKRPSDSFPAIKNKGVSISLVIIVGGAISAAMGAYFQLEERARNISHQGISRHENTRIDKAHEDIADQYVKHRDFSKSQIRIETLHKNVEEVKHSQKEINNKLDSIQRTLRIIRRGQ